MYKNRNLVPISRKENESDFEYKIRLCNMKLNKEIDYSWEELVKVLGVKCNPDHLRKLSYGFKEFSEYINEKELARNDRIKVLIMNDLHIPYHRDDLFEVIRKHKNVDFIILGGDIIDCESCSSFDSLERPSVEQQLAMAHEVISKINKIIDPTKTKIICIKGNHEERYTRDIMKMQQKELQKMLNPNLLEMLQDGFTYYNKGKKSKYTAIENFEYIDSWYVKLFNNLVVCHPKNFSNIGGKVSEQVSEYFLNQGILEKGDVAIFGHTHKFSMLKNNRRQGIFVVENGCMCKAMEYASNGKLGYTPQNSCYTYLEFENGKKININDIKVTHLE